MQAVNELPNKGASLVVAVSVGAGAIRLVPVVIGEQLQDSILRSQGHGEEIAHNFMSTVDDAFVDTIGPVLVVQFIETSHGYWVTTVPR